ncbi:MAG TPA: tetratricopeptide repeat protein, partial [Longimicrobiales bacterium]|nr:tetratricopeptide repeat protein [Longimicrobiales bacterium]
MDKRRLFQLVTLFGLPVFLLIVAELVLALADYRTTYEREDPFLGFKSVTPLFERRQSVEPPHETVWASRESKLSWFNYQEFALEKPEDGYRIFCFGGSTTYGRPYEHDTAFSNWLRVLLSAADPSTDFEVVNVGGVSYASYRIVNLMKEMVEHEPDLFVVYTGHNEFLEERTYSEILEEPRLVTRLRTVLHRSRTYSLARDAWLRVRGRERAEAEEKFEMSGEVTAILDQSFGLDQYRRDPEKSRAIVEHFRYNLERMVDLADDRGVRLVFVVPPANEKDFSPFKSQRCRSLEREERARWSRLYDEGRASLEGGDPGAALEAFRRAAAIDSCHADLRYRTGEALFALGRHGEAKREFTSARDLDVAPLRATTAVQETVREVARRRDVPVIDLVALLEGRTLERSGHDILGREVFLDHAHPRILVHQKLAEELAETAVREGWVRTERPLDELPTVALYDSVMATLDSSYYATRDLNLAKVLSWLGKDDEAAPFVARAAEALPDHPEAQYLRGVFYQYEGRFDRAEEAYKRAIALDSTFARAYNALGSVYERTGRLDEAASTIERAVRTEPDADHAYFALGNTLYQQGRPGEAIEAYQQAVAINPRHSKAWNNLAAVYITEERYDEAVDALRMTLELEPENFNAYKNLGLIAARRG